MYQIHQINDQVYMLKDDGDCFTTVVIGKEKALVFDTGCGLNDLLPAIHSITHLPLLTICSHGHFDHVGGSMAFEKVYLSKYDRNILDSYDEETLNRWLDEMSQGKDVHLSFNHWKHIADLDFDEFDLGDLPCNIIHTPGHSAGSVSVHIPSLGILLTGDALLPIMTLIFMNHGSTEELLETIKKLYNLNFEYYYTSHSFKAYDKKIMVRMMDCLENSKGKRFHKYQYPRPPHSDGYFYLHSLEDEPVGLIVESLE